MKVFSGVDLAQLGFLVWLHSHYGSVVRASYRDIEQQIEGITYGTIRLHLYALERKGFITIENKGTHRQSYHLNGDALKRFMSNAD